VKNEHGLDFRAVNEKEKDIRQKYRPRRNKNPPMALEDWIHRIRARKKIRFKFNEKSQEPSENNQRIGKTLLSRKRSGRRQNIPNPIVKSKCQKDAEE